MIPASSGTRDAVRELVINSLPDPAALGSDQVLFGPGGVLDSLALVNYLADLEYGVTEKFGRDLVLASDAAMSRSRSPFRSVDALTDYIVELLEA